VLTVTDALGIVSVYEYDDLGRQTKVTQDYINGVYNPVLPSEDVATSYAYNALGQVVSVTDALGVVTAYGAKKGSELFFH